MKTIASAFWSVITSLNGLHLFLLFGGLASVGILCGAGEQVVFGSLHAQSADTSSTLSEVLALRLAGLGALLAAAGVTACQFLEDGSLTRRSLLFVYASSFLVAVFVLLLHWFAVSGASGFQS